MSLELPSYSEAVSSPCEGIKQAQQSEKRGMPRWDTTTEQLVIGLSDLPCPAIHTRPSTPSRKIFWHFVSHQRSIEAWHIIIRAIIFLIRKRFDLSPGVCREFIWTAFFSSDSEWLVAAVIPAVVFSLVATHKLVYKGITDPRVIQSDIRAVTISMVIHSVSFALWEMYDAWCSSAVCNPHRQ